MESLGKRFSSHVGGTLIHSPPPELIAALGKVDDSLKDPGSFFIGSFNREYGSDPVLRQHYHQAVFFPYFTGGGDFRTAVFDLGRETTVADVQKRFAGHHVHLVHLGARGEWAAPGQAR